MLHQGLAKIETMGGSSLRSGDFDAAAAGDRMQIAELTNLISALDELERDITTRKEVVSCPRCSSHDVSYRISPSELGFTLYKCSGCTNAWRIQQFSMKIG